MKLNPEWENLPAGYNFATDSFEINISRVLSPCLAGADLWMDNMFNSPYHMFNGEQGINTMSMLFCQRGGIIMAVESGQKITSYTIKELEISTNSIALSNAVLESATSLKDWTQKKIQALCNVDGVVYFDEDGFQRVKGTGLVSDPYLVAVAEYYQTSAIAEKVGDAQGYGAIFQVTYSSGKKIFVTMGDLKEMKIA